MFASGKFLRWPRLATLKSREAVLATSNPSAPFCVDPADDLSLRLALLAEQCGEAVLICDARQRIVFANLAFQRLMGVAAHGVIGERPEQVHALIGERLAMVSVAIPAGSAAIAHYVCVLAPPDQSKRAEERLQQFITVA
jgi:PAS domain-containing protein